MTMILKKAYKTLNGAQKRAAFENAHCGGRYHYSVVRYVRDQPDTTEVNIFNWGLYTWRLDRKNKPPT